MSKHLLHTSVFLLDNSALYFIWLPSLCFKYYKIKLHSTCRFAFYWQPHHISFHGHTNSAGFSIFMRPIFTQLRDLLHFSFTLHRQWWNGSFLFSIFTKAKWFYQITKWFYYFRKWKNIEWYMQMALLYSNEMESDMRKANKTKSEKWISKIRYFLIHKLVMQMQTWRGGVLSTIYYLLRNILWFPMGTLVSSTL